MHSKDDLVPVAQGIKAFSILLISEDLSDADL